MANNSEDICVRRGNKLYWSIIEFERDYLPNIYTKRSEEDESDPDVFIRKLAEKIKEIVDET